MERDRGRRKNAPHWALRMLANLFEMCRSCFNGMSHHVQQRAQQIGSVGCALCKQRPVPTKPCAAREFLQRLKVSPFLFQQLK